MTLFREHATRYARSSLAASPTMPCDDCSLVSAPGCAPPEGDARPPAGRLAGAEYDAFLRGDFAAFVQRAFHELYPRSQFLMNWHLQVIAARLAAVRIGRIRRLLISLPPRHLKSLWASIAFPAWILGHEPRAEILCVTPGL